jgi:hypothetical protein
MLPILRKIELVVGAPEVVVVVVVLVPLFFLFVICARRKIRCKRGE